tara:strand:- start:1138 stop:2820 length:1683 start_codon:yes stop_codon:yes gene_type:complete
MVMANEVFVGAGASATMIPEAEIYLGTNGTIASNKLTQSDTTIKLVPDLYSGCVVKIVDTAPSPDTTDYYTISTNDATSITLDRNITSAAATSSATILKFGTPVPAPQQTINSDTVNTLLSDNWLGLVNTLTPPNVEVEMKQMNLALAGTRNFAHQYKGAETISGGSLDISMNNGSWLYYALGKISGIAHTKHSDGGTTFTATTNSSVTLTAVDSFNSIDIGDVLTHGHIPAGTKIIAFNPTAETITLDTAATGSGTGQVVTIDTSSDLLTNETGENTYINGTKIVRTLAGNEYPPVASQTSFEKAGAGNFAYTFEELNGDELPSFAIEVSYNKSGNTNKYVDTANPNTDMFSRVFTGCQVNSMTMSFEEGQELKTSLDLVTRRAFDSPENYAPHRAVSGASNMYNFSSTMSDNSPFMYSDGALTLFGQSYARVKTGSLVISNNITQQRYIGNTKRGVMSAHVPAQRTYELSLTLLVTDTTIWDELRAMEEYDTDAGTIKLNFTKDSGELIEIELDDYIIQSVNIPFPDDKGPIEVEMTASARTLTGAKYTGKWAILNTD